MSPRLPRAGHGRLLQTQKFALTMGERPVFAKSNQEWATGAGNGIRCLRAHLECNQNANPVLTTVGATKLIIIIIIIGNELASGVGGMDARQRTINKIAGLTGMATAV